MPGYQINKMGEIIFEDVDLVSVSDVYDLACEIGKECETLIATVGTEPVNTLVKKVIVTLELLERFATRNENENLAMTEMSGKIELLEAEKEQRTESRHKFEKDIETVEEQWLKESRELLVLVSRLQDENKRLKEGASVSAAPVAVKTNHDLSAELDNMQKVLRHEMDNHKNEILRRDERIQSQQEDMASLQLQVEALTATNTDAKRFQRELQAQIRSLVNERTNLISRVQDQHLEIVSLKRDSSSYKVGEQAAVAVVDKEKEDKVTDKQSANDNVTSSSTVDDGDEAPVQGPMPYEPDDAPWKRPSRRDSESGIRKFFRQLFLEPNKAPFANYTFESTFSKMENFL